ncbi:WAP four-disulfide core domain protein 6B [Orchesella cincta]|uniref:WAP four-disulfide core domain protein 6B n=1 Tax=Orchesella cincta TaxID=48709 RepID=A0A1D2M2C8_ORCCI|nr:WAP four-disulfide core domain protein 6B [Orchesella cincta]
MSIAIFILLVGILSDDVLAGALKFPCTAVKRPGPCMSRIQRWWYNSKTRKCEEFTYGGCGANSNNHETKEVCEALCKKSRKPKKYT